MYMYVFVFTYLLLCSDDAYKPVDAVISGLASPPSSGNDFSNTLPNTPPGSSTGKLLPPYSTEKYIKPPFHWRHMEVRFQWKMSDQRSSARSSTWSGMQ